jgi:predicted CoA-substrate-specific enzyme activase
MATSEKVVGLDIGSRAIKMVALKDGQIVEKTLTPTTFYPTKEIQRLLNGVKPDHIVATGHGRDICRNRPDCPDAEIVSTVMANVRGGSHVEPRTRRILDIGALETLVISLTPRGDVYNYELSTICAAGTGKYLEIMASSLQMPLVELGDFALQADKRIQMESQCTVFAEREAMFLVANGEKPQNIAMALHRAIIERTVDVLRRVGGSSPLLLVGGLAHNRCIKTLLEEQLQEDVLVPDDPDYVGALGAALQSEALQN